MNQVVLAIVAIAIFGVGFFAGHYRSTEGLAQIDAASSNQQNGRSPPTTKNLLDQSDISVGHIPRSEGSTPLSIPLGQHQKVDNALQPNPVLLPHEMMPSLEEQAQWEAQQQEAWEAGMAELDDLIQSMTEAGLPEEDIKNLQQLKEAQAKALPDAFQRWDSPPSERSPDELREDFATSLEQANIPEGERPAMLEGFSHQFEPTERSIFDSSTAPPPPLQGFQD